MQFSAFFFFLMKAETKMVSATPVFSTIFSYYGEENGELVAQRALSASLTKGREEQQVKLGFKNPKYSPPGNETAGNGWRIPIGIDMGGLCDLIP